eukprot:s658_g31.t1
MSKLKKKEKAEKALREEDTSSSTGATDGSHHKTTTFKAYDLTGLPDQALHAIEVLCKQQAYYIKKSVDGTPKPSSYQVSWSKHGGAIGAWNEARRRAGLSAVEQ